ncbi:voltage-gated monoatomic cation channel TMEM109 isoform X2 [Pelodiscus sinensis]|uniref:voltage-gated monoatomic cation channel TMEM109 isoform X2 n=1 Tax=Pelodiscus sinensis TaxID=13735 RepID=UPI003F6D0DFE
MRAWDEVGLCPRKLMLQRFETPGAERRAREMTGRDLKSSCCRQALLRLAMALLMSIAFLHVAGASTHGETWKAAVHSDFLSQLAQGLRETLEEWIGQDALQLVTENVSSVFWIVSSGISAGLITLSGIAGQILSAFGVNGDQVVQPLKLGPAQVQTLLLWGLVAVVGYWLLSQLLGLVLAILGHVMWGLKVVVFLGCFLLIVSAVPNRSVQALLLLCLLTLYALLGRLSSARRSGSQLEAKVRNLEWQVEELRRRQRRGSPWNVEQDE